MRTNQLFPDVSFERRPKIKVLKKMNLVAFFPNVSAERLPKTKSKVYKNPIQLFPDVSGELRNKKSSADKPGKGSTYESSFFNSSALIENRNLKWILIITTLLLTLLIYLKTFSL